MKKKTTFALFFGNRGFMPAELIAGARRDMIKAVSDAGYDYLVMDEAATRYGAVETRDEGLQYAAWLKEHEGQYDGVIFSMSYTCFTSGKNGRVAMYILSSTLVWHARHVFSSRSPRIR